MLSFTVCLKPAYLFYHGLRVMKKMASSAVLCVQRGYVKVVADSEDCKIELIMKDLTATSCSSRITHTVQFDLFDWVDLLIDARNFDQSIWICMYGDRRNVYCLIGDGSTPIELGEAKLVQFNGVISRTLPNDPRWFVIQMTTECLREVISTCAFSYDHVMMLVFARTVIFLTVSQTLLFHTKDGDCLVGGVQPGTCKSLLVEWRGATTLTKASKITSHVLICPSFHQNGRLEAITFIFKDGELNALGYFMRACT